MSRKANILVVDDDAGVRDGLRRILGHRGYAVETAVTAENALALLAERPFDLIVTDLHMPGMDGMALLDEIKQRSPSIPVIMITAFAAVDTVIQALRRGVSDFLTKPYKPDELLTIVERETGRQAPDGSMGAPPAVLGRQLLPAQLDEIGRILAELRAETGARCVLMVEGTGHVVDAKGVIEDINVSALAALVAGDFAATAGIASLIGEGEAFRLNYHEGSRYSVYSAHLAPDLFLLIVFGQDVRSGMVLYATRQALPRLLQIAEQAAAQPVRAPEPAGPLAEPVLAHVVEETETAPGELFSFDDILSSGLLGDDALLALDDQFKGLWK